ncbi:MAG: PTS sugar transporter subunit IIB [Lactovum sp.]
MNITLICAGGMSTNLLVKNMKEYAAKEGIEGIIKAMSVDSFAEYEGHTDVLMLGPQIKYRLNEIQERYSNRLKVSVIDMTSYGMLDGKKVVQEAVKLLNTEL